MRGYSVDVGVVPIAVRDDIGNVVRKQLEVDFVCNMAQSGIIFSLHIPCRMK